MRYGAHCYMLKLCKVAYRQSHHTAFLKKHILVVSKLPRKRKKRWESMRSHQSIERAPNDRRGTINMHGK